MQVDETSFSGQVLGGGGDRVVLVWHGDLDADAGPEALELVSLAAGLATGDVWVEASGLTFIGAAGIGALAILADRVTSQGHRVHLVGAGPMLIRLLAITELSEWFTVAG